MTNEEELLKQLHDLDRRYDELLDGLEDTKATLPLEADPLKRDQFRFQMREMEGKLSQIDDERSDAANQLQDFPEALEKRMQEIAEKLSKTPEQREEEKSQREQQRQEEREQQEREEKQAQETEREEQEKAAQEEAERLAQQEKLDQQEQERQERQDEQDYEQDRLAQQRQQELEARREALDQTLRAQEEEQRRTLFEQRTREEAGQRAEGSNAHRDFIPDSKESLEQIQHEEKYIDQAGPLDRIEGDNLSMAERSNLDLAAPALDLNAGIESNWTLDQKVLDLDIQNDTSVQTLTRGDLEHLVKDWVETEVALSNYSVQFADLSDQLLEMARLQGDLEERLADVRDMLQDHGIDIAPDWTPEKDISELMQRADDLTQTQESVHGQPDLHLADKSTVELFQETTGYDFRTDDPFYPDSRERLETAWNLDPINESTGIETASTNTVDWLLYGDDADQAQRQESDNIEHEWSEGSVPDWANDEFQRSLSSVLEGLEADQPQWLDERYMAESGDHLVSEQTAEYGLNDSLSDSFNESHAESSRESFAGDLGHSSQSVERDDDLSIGGR